MLKAENLIKSFGNRLILDGVSATVRPGEITALIGPSGSGKTTLLRALAGIEQADSGTVTLDSAPLNHPWPRLTVVFQELFLWPHLTLEENILLPARNVGYINVDEAFADVVQLLNMESFINNYPSEASLGQRQRAAIARAIMLKPQYILMDEITSALDIEQVHNILSLLPMLKERGIGILLITHHISFARKATDQVLFLADGKIAEHGPAAILDAPQSPRLQQFLSIVNATA